MLTCTLGKIDSVIIRKAFSAYTFAEFTVPMESYSDSPTFSLTVDNITTDYKIVGSEVYMKPGDKTVVRVNAIPSSQEKWMEVFPFSVDSAEASDILKSLGISGGPNIPITLLNLFLNRGQASIVLANLSPKTAFVDFSEEKVVYYSDLYKKKAMQLSASFRRLYSRVPLAGYIGWDSIVTGSFPDDAQYIAPLGHFDNIDETTMQNLLNNCNEIARLFSDMQVFTQSTDIPLGTTVLSSLTYDKKVVVAAEEQWDINDNMITAYYCI